MKAVFGIVLSLMRALCFYKAIWRWWQMWLCLISTSSHVLAYIVTLTFVPVWFTAVAFIHKLYLLLTGIDCDYLTKIFLTIFGRIITSIESPAGSRAWANIGKLYSHCIGCVWIKIKFKCGSILWKNIEFWLLQKVGKKSSINWKIWNSKFWALAKTKAQISRLEH